MPVIILTFSSEHPTFWRNLPRNCPMRVALEEGDVARLQQELSGKLMFTYGNQLIVYLTC